MEGEHYQEPQQNNFEQREQEIDALISRLAEQEGMEHEDILSDIATFARHDSNGETNPDHNPDYLEEVAEKLSISIEEMDEYADKKSRDNKLE